MLVYKYRGGNKKIFERDLNSIGKNYFWGASFKELNDPCENLILSDKIKKQINLLDSILASKKSKELNSINSALDNFLLQNKKIGIYSLSQSYDDELLWAHYANSHKGFCIEYDLNLLIKDYRFHFPIRYDIKPPEIGIDDVALNIDGIIQKMAGYKSKRWEYEQEVRILTNNHGSNNYDYRALKSIYFGLRMEGKQETDIMNRLKGRGVKYYKIELVPNSYKFQVKPINDINDPEITYLKQIPSIITGKRSIGFKIIKQNYWAIRGKGNAKIEIEKPISKEVLTWLSDFIKENLFYNNDTVFIEYFLKNQKEKGWSWAITHFKNDKTEITINDFVA